MRRVLPILLVVLVALPAVLSAQAAESTAEALIRNALSAAPASVAEGATVMDHDQNILREGTNGWVCLPDMPDVPNNSPMCLDEPWLEMLGALMSQRQPDFRGIGIGYMLQGDMPVSNVDPFATAPTSDNEWVPDAGPHIMIIVSDPSLVEDLPTDPEAGGPWLMWKGTPYAHIMIPTEGRDR